MTTLRQALLITISLSLLIGACARRPNIPVVAAPAPTEAPAPAAPAPPPPAPCARRPRPRPPPPAAGARPRRLRPRRLPGPKEFQPNDNVKPIYFDFDKSTIRPGDAKILDASATWLKANDPAENHRGSR